MSEEYEAYLRLKVSAQQQIDFYREEVRELKAERERMFKSNVEKNNEVLRLLAENAALRELLERALTSHNKMCANRGTCLECLFFNAKPFEPACPIVSVTRGARELGVEAGV